MIKVSVIVPVYNVAGYLAKCLETLVNQTLQEIEIIVVNDGSTDRSPDIIRKYAEHYPDKIIALDKKNGGLSEARNFGMSYAKGKYIGYIDSDDFVDLDMMELLYNKAEAEQADYVECDLHHTYSGYEDTEKGVHYFNKNELIMYGRSVVWNKIYNREWLQRTGVEFAVGLYHEDVDFFIRIVPHIRKIAYIDHACVHYVQRGTSINNSKSRKLLDIHTILAGLIQYYIEQGYYDRYKSALEYLFLRILLGSAFIRFSKIDDKKIRNEIFKENWSFLHRYFPNWKNNPTLKKQKGIKSIYMRMMNHTMYNLLSQLMPIIVRFRRV